jgi:hypothetical protein
MLDLTQLDETALRRLAGELESIMVDPNTWDTCGAPIAAVALAEEETKHRVPTGIARHPEHGWFVIQTSGQGPYIIWQEGDEPERCIRCSADVFFSLDERGICDRCVSLEDFNKRHSVGVLQTWTPTPAPEKVASISSTVSAVPPVLTTGCKMEFTVRVVACPFEHENISMLFGVPFMPIEQLPKICTCGCPLTYADEVAFVNEV